MTNAVLVIATLISLDIAFGLLKGRLPLLKKIAEGTPMVLIENGIPLTGRMRRARVELDDIMRAARESQGLECLEDIKFAILGQFLRTMRRCRPFLSSVKTEREARKTYRSRNEVKAGVFDYTSAI